MSQPPGKKQPSKAANKDSKNEEAAAPAPKESNKGIIKGWMWKIEFIIIKCDSASSKDAKDSNKEETGSNPEVGDEATGGGSKPQSAGASLRDAAQRILVLCQKAEWSPVDQVLKSLEKSIAAAAGGEDVNTTPLAGVSDLV